MRSGGRERECEGEGRRRERKRSCGHQLEHKAKAVTAEVKNASITSQGVTETPNVLEQPTIECL